MTAIKFQIGGHYLAVKRGLDVLMSLAGLLVFLLPSALIALAIACTSPGPVLFWSERVGQGNRMFKMPKFRTMRVGAPLVETDLLGQPDTWITPLGRLLRRSSLDEVPQLWSVLKGDMSLVGPRPALPSQGDLVRLRTLANIHLLRPGLTGLAQVSGRDNLSSHQKVTYDQAYFEGISLFLDCKLLLLTVDRVFRGQGVKH